MARQPWPAPRFRPQPGATPEAPGLLLSLGGECHSPSHSLSCLAEVTSTISQEVLSHLHPHLSLSLSPQVPPYHLFFLKVKCTAPFPYLHTFPESPESQQSITEHTVQGGFPLSIPPYLPSCFKHQKSALSRTVSFIPWSPQSLVLSFLSLGASLTTQQTSCPYISP